MTALAFLLGVLIIIPIGGADMPVVISMLNSYSGWAAAGIGFSLNNPMLIIAGSLVGSSGAILSYIMCKAMNRSFISVILGGFGAAEGTAVARRRAEDGASRARRTTSRSCSATPRSVIIVPGYGLAVARAQHAVKEMAQRSCARRASTCATRSIRSRVACPGHMNVLLAEAEVPYDQVFEMEDINSDFGTADVVLVLGANDVVNPLAEQKGSPIYGMPILEAHKARTVHRQQALDGLGLRRPRQSAVLHGQDDDGVRRREEDRSRTSSRRSSSVTDRCTRSPGASRRGAGDGRGRGPRSMPGPLAHLTVLDLSRVLAGPWCTQLLADLGATVIKIERPGTGDDTRAWGPPYLKDADGARHDRGRVLPRCNRGKLSVAVDFTKPDGQRDRDARLARDGGRARRELQGRRAREATGSTTRASAQVEPAHRLLLDHRVRAERTVRRRAPATTSSSRACRGFMSVTGERTTCPAAGRRRRASRSPTWSPGCSRRPAILAALAHRERTGAGPASRHRLLDSAVAMMSVMNLNYLVTGVAPERLGNAHPNIVPYQVFACADGHLILAVGNDSQFANFCEVAGKPEWARDPRFAKNADRVRDRAVLVPMIEAVMRTRTQRDWLERSSRSACRAVRSTRSTRCSPIRRSSRAACASTCRIRSPDRCRRSARRCATRRRR